MKEERRREEKGGHKRKGQDKLGDFGRGEDRGDEKRKE